MIKLNDEKKKFTVVSKYVLIQVLPLILHAEKIEKGYVFLGEGRKIWWDGCKRISSIAQLI